MTGVGFRPEVQALRALAVMMVVVNHLWPAQLPGGFAGVDVFFVISGFLITGHLTRELVATGRMDLPSFWSRRVRRLLPAALAVLAACLVLTLGMLPSSMWRENLGQIVASTFYVENWVLVASSTDYFAAEDAATTVQHYWSLSVEEQFYLVWPLMLVVAVWLATRSSGPRGSQRRRAIVTSIAIVGLVSLAASIVFAGIPGGGGYFSTVTRVWEFMAGAALVFLPTLTRWPAWVAVMAGWLGVAVIVACAFGLRGATDYPGVVALLPVVGTVLVIAGGSPLSRWSISSIARRRSVRYLGDISYSLYLWHWPLIVAAPFALVAAGGFASWWQRALVLALSVVLAGLTKRYVEERFRRAPAGVPRTTANRRALILPLAAGVVMLAAAGTVMTVVVTPRAHAVEQAFDALREDGCLGADAVVNGCDDPFGTGPSLDPMLAAADRVPVCGSSLGRPAAGETAATCVYGDAATRPVIAVVGDSHAQIIAYYTARWALEHGYAVREFTSPACPVIARQELAFPHANRATTAESVDSWEACRQTAEGVLSEVAEDQGIVGVVVTNATRTYIDQEAPDRSILAFDVAERALRELSRDDRPVLVVRDVPGLDFDQGTAPQCLAQHPDDVSACAAPRADVTLADDPMVEAADRVGAATLDLSDFFCDAALCYPAVGGVIAYWDRAHLTRTMADTLEPAIDDALEEAFG
ncbi:acyltransferase family protein [Microbacterium sp. SLBN-146]|uniref:acyltransferase family protein n=1 Tax=Microbacterium sp. SLBN-146 TaxID=2768457 RepID=UPI001175009C|nr:acyltransferase family protein [Microbacterium sp. SLBN-146]TQJ30873.1 peptidoglycan/LPS O-acetylase OafA/YrhL [Microbacterium sp. SLBN-146]